MKVVVFLALALAAVSAAPAPYKLVDDFSELFRLINFEKLLREGERELLVNGEAIEVVNYMNADNWANIVKTGKEDKNFDSLRKVLSEKNIQLDMIGDQITRYMNSLKLGKSDGKSTFKVFLENLMRFVPVQSVLSWIVRKEMLSADFRALMHVLRDQQTKLGADKLVLTKEFQGLEKLLTGFDVDIKPLLQLFYTVFGWGKVPEAQVWTSDLD